MEGYSAYPVKIEGYNRIFRKTTELYRRAVEFFISVADREWDSLSGMDANRKNNQMEKLTIATKKRPEVPYDFGKEFYKFPSYLRRSAIREAVGAVASYRSRMAAWENAGRKNRGRKPGRPKAGRVFPVLYHKQTFIRTGECRARIKVFTRNTWDWLDTGLKKTDVDYIRKHCSGKTECSPALEQKGKEWFLVFPFREKYSLKDRPLPEQTVLGVDLGLNQACVCTTMKADGTIAGRSFLKLPAEQDRLNKAVGRIKKAQQHGAARTPRLWSLAKGINDDIAVKTAAFIIEEAERRHVDVIIFEHLELGGRKRGSKKQKLHLWKARYVQSMVTQKAHRLGIRIRRVNAWGTSRLAYDGSGRVERDIGGNYSICRFKTGKIYHCDLNASYNIGARYFIGQYIKSMPETVRLAMEAKVPACAKRSTCTLSTLINLYAELHPEREAVTEFRLYRGEEILPA